MDFDYKKYSLEKLETWVEDALNSAEASPQEIYDCIRKVVEDNYYYYKNQTSRCYELLSLLNGNGNHFSEIVNKEEVKEEPKTWTLPVEFDGEDAIVTLPEEIIEMKGWEDGDVLEWVDRGDGSWELRKASQTLKMDEC